ncbi:hypothetical protein BDZ89DRAFT_1132313 [Hymenopellis radicata]|nr:hypothetical protein BDZ89DRAFT_1132313 [Hymenopellis radicata]
MQSALRSTLPRLADPDVEDASTVSVAELQRYAPHPVSLEAERESLRDHIVGIVIPPNVNLDNLFFLRDIAAKMPYLEEVTPFNSSNLNRRRRRSSATAPEFAYDNDNSDKENQPSSDVDESEEEEETPQPKRLRTRSKTTATEEALQSIPSAPVDNESLRREFIDSLIRPSIRFNKEDERKAFLENDPCVDHDAELYVDRVKCSGCRKYKSLDKRGRSYYLTNWLKHRPLCPGLFNRWLAERA